VQPRRTLAASAVHRYGHFRREPRFERIIADELSARVELLARFLAIPQFPFCKKR